MSWLLHDSFHHLCAPLHISNRAFDDVAVMDGCDKLPVVSDALAIEIDQRFVFNVTRNTLYGSVDTLALNLIGRAEKEPLSACCCGAGASVSGNSSGLLKSFSQLWMPIEILSVCLSVLVIGNAEVWNLGTDRLIGASDPSTIAALEHMLLRTVAAIFPIRVALGDSKHEFGILVVDVLPFGKLSLKNIIIEDVGHDTQFKIAEVSTDKCMTGFGDENLTGFLRDILRVHTSLPQASQPTIFSREKSSILGCIGNILSIRRLISRGFLE